MPSFLKNSLNVRWPETAVTKFRLYNGAKNVNRPEVDGGFVE